MAQHCDFTRDIGCPSLGGSSHTEDCGSSLDASNAFSGRREKYLRSIGFTADARSEPTDISASRAAIFVTLTSGEDRRLLRKFFIALVVALLFLLGNGPAQAQLHVKFKSCYAGWWRFCIGAPHLEVGPDEFRMYNAATASIGSYGHWETGPTGGKTFSRLGGLRIAEPVQGRIVQIESEEREDINATGDFNVPGSTTDFDTEFKASGKRSFIATIWHMSDPLAYLRELIKKMEEDPLAASSARSDAFRFIASVVMVSKYEANITENISGSLEGSVADFFSGGFEAKVVGSADSETSVKIDDAAVIGYQWYAICWENGEAATVRLHDLAIGDRPDDCESYEDST